MKKIDTLVWETSLCFNDKFQIQLEKEEKNTTLIDSILPKNNNSLFLKYHSPAPRYKDLIKKEIHGLSFDSTANKVTPTSNNKNNFKIPNTVIPIQKTNSFNSTKNRKNLFFNKNKENNESYKPPSNVIINNEKINIFNATSAATSPLSTDSSKAEISFAIASSSTPIRNSNAVNIFNDNLFLINKNVISNVDSPDNIIEVMDMDKNNDVPMEDVNNNNNNIIKIEEEKVYTPNTKKSFKSENKSEYNNLNETHEDNSLLLIKKKTEDNVIIEIKSRAKQELHTDKMDFELSPISNDNNDIRKLSSSDKSLTPTYILNSSGTNSTIITKPSMIYDINKVNKKDNNINDNNNNENKEADDDVDVDVDDDKPLNIYITKKKRLNKIKQEKNSEKPITKRKDIIGKNENVKKKQKLNPTSTEYNDNSNNKILITDTLPINNKNKESNNNFKRNIDDDNNDDNNSNNDDNDNNNDNKNDNDGDVNDELRNNEIYQYSNKERDEKFLHDLCAKINSKKEYWNESFHYLKGTIVWALWKDLEDNFYYVGKITNFTSKKYRIKFFDGDMTSVSKNHLRQFNIKPDDIVCVSLEDDIEFNGEDGINGLCIVQIIKKINEIKNKDKNHEIKYEAVILKKKLDETNNTFILENTKKTIIVALKNFVLPENFLKIIDEQKKEFDKKLTETSIKVEIPLKKPKIETNKIFEDYSFIVTVGSDESENQMKKSSNIEDQTYITSTVDKSEIQNQIEKLGGTFIKNVNDIFSVSKHNYKNIPSNFVVIASIPSRTKKFLVGLALKLPIISYIWVKECFKAEKFLSYNDYLLSHGFSRELNSYIGSNYSSNELFNNLRFYLIGNVNFKSTYKLLISHSGGIIVSSQKLKKNPNFCNYIICGKDSKKKEILKLSQLIKKHNNNNSFKRRSLSRSSSILTSNDFFDQTEGEMDITEDDLLETDLTTENEDDPQNSYRNFSDISSVSMPYIKSQPIFLEDEWIIQCLINQRIVDYTNYLNK
ncbi:hypothetical protein BCR36DRAFT_341300 [Piromyces finnis]|uniref:BRCT domain-containing protein n=1 Tax=Piromyces finnis TaxID=1754191 RepID=A0A1Y1VNV0_9FUNG|nr:hypothetical protein BCR36DRAFT_341300 [Piromyces finnis]|eukprot:ORX61079.1 hypothetical protein BCR36DRAFT_341300 [Piromyces finnis]